MWVAGKGNEERGEKMWSVRAHAGQRSQVQASLQGFERGTNREPQGHNGQSLVQNQLRNEGILHVAENRWGSSGLCGTPKT